MLGSFKKIEEDKYLSGDTNKPIEIDVVVSVTYHKSFKVKVDDYTIVDEWVDEDGNYNCEMDFSSCNLYDAVMDNVDSLNPSEENGWTRDELEVVIDK